MNLISALVVSVRSHRRAFNNLRIAASLILSRSPVLFESSAICASTAHGPRLCPGELIMLDQNQKIGKSENPKIKKNRKKFFCLSPSNDQVRERTTPTVRKYKSRGGLPKHDFGTGPRETKLRYIPASTFPTPSNNFHVRDRSSAAIWPNTTRRRSATIRHSILRSYFVTLTLTGEW